MADIKKYIAEFIGTCVLVTIACGVAVVTGANVVATSLAFGLVIVAMAYSIGNISGCHINPAVSLAMLISKKMSVKDFICYVVAQVLGAIVGAVLVGLLCGSFSNEPLSMTYGAFGQNATSGILTTAYGETGALFVALIVEIVLTFVFVTAIMGVTSKTDNKAVTGIVIGLALTLVHLIGISLTGTSVNPARSIGPALMSMVDGGFKSEALQQIWIFIVGPLAGGALAAVVYNFLDSKKDKKELLNND